MAGSVILHGLWGIRAHTSAFTSYPPVSTQNTCAASRVSLLGALPWRSVLDSMYTSTIDEGGRYIRCMPTSKQRGRGAAGPKGPSPPHAPLSLSCQYRLSGLLKRRMTAMLQNLPFIKNRLQAPPCHFFLEERGHAHLQIFPGRRVTMFHGSRVPTEPPRFATSGDDVRLSPTWALLTGLGRRARPCLEPDENRLARHAWYAVP